MILALIQARMGSTRLPGKSMADLCGKPLIEHVVRRVQASKYVERACVCTTEDASDDGLASHVASLGVDVYRGATDDVLSRFYWASERYPDANIIVRICADDPFVDPALIDHALLAWGDLTENPVQQIGRPHYLCLGGLTWPLGMGVEVFSGHALNEAFKNASDPYEREHVTPYMHRNFFQVILKDEPPRKSINTRWTIDTQADLDFARSVYERLYPEKPLFGYADLIEAGY